EARARQRNDGRDHGPVLALRGRGVDREFHRGLSDPMSGDARGGTTGTRAAGHEAAHGHPTVGLYLRVAAVLVVLTVLEVGVFYVPAFHPVLVPTLLVLSAVKFTLVVLFYMHLRSDSRFFSFLFGTPLILAAGVLVALLLLFCA